MRSVILQDCVFRVLHAGHRNDCRWTAVRLFCDLQPDHIPDLLKQPKQLTFRHLPVKARHKKGEFR